MAEQFALGSAVKSHQYLRMNFLSSTKFYMATNKSDMLDLQPRFERATFSISPPVATFWVAANKKQCHTFFSSGQGFNLEKNSFSMVALSTTNRLCTWKSRICSYILQHLSALPNRMMYLISIDTFIICSLQKMTSN
ncbi:uncharacterized protein LOC114711505 [Neltuma alba]|uniref:uncharacterized protein LOC114711505 n=1 Tax=Neltuma alba TaxID=207710 RepID=UPI0010A3661A|nr:uncharacterized protein LOC114711505 [Prosopis alba]